MLIGKNLIAVKDIPRSGDTSDSAKLKRADMLKNTILCSMTPLAMRRAHQMILSRARAVAGGCCCLRADR